MNFKHGYARKGQVTRLFNIWRGMLKRCNPKANAIATRRYAARGIYVCLEWQEFESFRNWAESNGYADNLTLERENNDGPYGPWNCAWKTLTEQARNRRTTRWITLAGRTQALAAWLEETGVSGSAYHARLERGWSLERAIGIET